MTDRYATGVVAALTLIALLCLAFLVPVPYVTMRPGPAFDTLGEFGDKPMFTIKGAKTYPTKGMLDFTTVSITSPEAKFTFVDSVQALVDGDIALLPREFVYPEDQSPADNEAQSAAQLAGSKDHAKVAALRAAGFTVPETAQVVDVTKDSPADGQVRAGDWIFAVDGKAVTSAEQVGQLVQDRAVGDEVELTLKRKGKDVAVTLTTAEGDDGTPRIGIAMRANFTYPVEIINNVDDSVGGSSAGTMFALAIYDLLTPGALTGGLKVAGTGEISASGVVGRIGGLKQKVAGAEAAKAQVFLVPDGNCADVKGIDSDMTLVRVETLRGAIDALTALAKDPKASVPHCG